MNADHCPGHGKPSEHIIGGRDQTLWIVPFACMIETAFGIELLSVLLCCRQVVFGAIDTDDRHSMPKVGWVSGPEFVGQFHGVFEDIPEDGPW
jgi:hypothetical protein